jgi:hypothetical protein
MTTPTEGRGSQHRRKIKIVGTHVLKAKPSPTSPLQQVPTRLRTAVLRTRLVTKDTPLISLPSVRTFR